MDTHSLCSHVLTSRQLMLRVYTSLTNFFCPTFTWQLDLEWLGVWGITEDMQTSNTIMKYEKAERQLGVVVFTFNSSTWKAEAGGSLWGQGQPGLCSEFQNSQGYVERPCLKDKRKWRRKKKVLVIDTSHLPCTLSFLSHYPIDIREWVTPPCVVTIVLGIFPSYQGIESVSYLLF